MEKILFTYQIKPRKSRLNDGVKVDMESRSLVVDAKNKSLYIKCFQGNMGYGFGGRGATCEEWALACSVEMFHTLLRDYGSKDQKRKYKSFNGDNWEVFI